METILYGPFDKFLIAFFCKSWFYKINDNTIFFSLIVNLFIRREFFSNFIHLSYQNLQKLYKI